MGEIKQAYIDELKNRLSESTIKVKVLEQRIEKADIETGHKLYQKMAKLRKKNDKTRTIMQQLIESDWDHLKQDFEKTWKKLQKSLKKMAKGLNHQWDQVNATMDIGRVWGKIPNYGTLRRMNDCVWCPRKSLFVATLLSYTLMFASVYADDLDGLSGKLQQIFSVHEGKVGHTTVLLKLENHYKKYRKKFGKKVMVVAYEEGGEYVWSYGKGRDAEKTALDFCNDYRERNRLNAECKVLARNKEFVLEKY